MKKLWNRINWLGKVELTSVRAMMKNTYRDYHSNSVSASTRVGLDILFDQLDARVRISKEPVFSAYAQLTRMAGRFVEQYRSS
ncbi:hypothetical protein ABVB70_26800 [Agrobacterium radiobacter]|uniref:Uncharacterized protein n=1 Tax=Agrobacterium radiobacter TaxID=362 RepID=A0ABD5LQ27_AGRRD